MNTTSPIHSPARSWGRDAADGRGPEEFVVTVVPSGECFGCASGESLLRGMLRLGRRGIPVGCLAGGCGICKVRVVSGQVAHLGPVSRTHVGSDEEAAGLTLACRVTPLSALHVEAVGHLAIKFEHQALATRVRQCHSTNGDQ